MGVKPPRKGETLAEQLRKAETDIYSKGSYEDKYPRATDSSLQGGDHHEAGGPTFNEYRKIDAANYKKSLNETL